jgi:Arc/MetJ-type ribon-helix-helix transcriptional regulator
MTIQITVRLPDEDVEFMDALVQDGEAASRASVVAAALQRERRRRAAERDVAILIETAGDPDPDDLDGLARWTTGRDLGLPD